jgi:hypothetical protein
MKGDRKRMTTTITVDPVEWANFQENVKKFLLDPSASEHLGTLIRNENARFNGQEGATNPEVDEATMQRQFRTLNGKYLEIQQLLEKKGAWNRLIGLANDYKLSSSNGEAVIGKLLHGIDREGTVVHRYVNNQGSESEVLLLINLIEVRDEMTVTRQKLKEVMKKRYKDTMPPPEEYTLKNLRGCQGRPGCPAEPYVSVFNGDEEERLMMCGKCSCRHSELLMQLRGEEKSAEKALAQLRSEDAEGKADEPPQEECVEQDEEEAEEETEEDTDEEDSYDQEEWVYSEE